ncbi:MAG: hypothetical protein PHS41_12875, partial [Victivallaceae bacterium]|nr:hypothetical protein [Victivallaceae bacterium]
AYDTYTPRTDPEQMPRNLQVWNFHSYCVWKIYALLEGDLLMPGTDVESSLQARKILRFRKCDALSLDEIRQLRAGKRPTAEDWVRRVWLYSGLDPEKMPELDRLLSAAFERDVDDFKRKLEENLSDALRFRNENAPEIPMILGEGITFCGSNHILWEEKSDCYWSFLEYAVTCYRKAGLWGCALRTCCGPEDPSWTMRKDEILRLNRLFLAE